MKYEWVLLGFLNDKWLQWIVFVKKLSLGTPSQRTKLIVWERNRSILKCKIDRHQENRRLGNGCCKKMVEIDKETMSKKKFVKFILQSGHSQSDSHEKTTKLEQFTTEYELTTLIPTLPIIHAILNVNPIEHLVGCILVCKMNCFISNAIRQYIHSFLHYIKSLINELINWGRLKTPSQFRTIDSIGIVKCSSR